MKYPFIEEHRSVFRVEKMCKVLRVSRSGYYKWRTSPKSNREKRREELTKRIQYHYQDNNGLYGSPKITHILRREGYRVAQKTVGRIMRENQLRSRTVRKFRIQTTDSNHQMPIAPNRLNQVFRTNAPNKVWVTDITYIRTRQGVMYLASVMDLFSRKIIGWELRDRMTKDLVEDALDKAYKNNRPGRGLIHHSDRGSQYASNDYRTKLEIYHMKASMSRKGNCYDNACIESFHSLLKRELVYQTKFATKAKAREEIYRYIEFWYNRKRLHSSLGYLSPDRFEAEYRKRKRKTVA
jgi:putative transposase